MSKFYFKFSTEEEPANSKISLLLEIFIGKKAGGTVKKIFPKLGNKEE